MRREEFVGNGRRMNIFDHTSAPYISFWRDTIDNTRRLLTNPLPPGQRQPKATALPTDQSIIGLPNVDLYNTLAATANAKQCAVFLFVFGAPFRQIALDDLLFNQAARVIPPIERSASLRTSWSISGFENSPSRFYQTLVMRFNYLAHLTAITRTNMAEALAKTRVGSFDDRTKARTDYQQCLAMEKAAQLWVDAHIILAVALKRLGHVPDDRDPQWAVLLELAPDINTMFHAGELPDCRNDVFRCNFFSKPPSTASGSAKTRATKLITALLDKMKPMRCASRDLIKLVTDHAARDSGSFELVTTLMAFFFLGLSSRATRRPDLPVRFGVYELFFSVLDPRLKPRKPSLRAEMRALFNIERTDISIYVTRGRPRIVFADWEEIVRQQFKNAVMRADTAAGDSKGADGKKKQKKAGATRQRGAQFVTTTAVTRRNAARSASSTAGSQASTPEENDLWNALSLPNAVARLEHYKQCGVDYFFRCQAANLLPPIPADAGFAHEPITSDTPITDTFAFRRRLPCDTRRVSPEEIERKRIVFRWLRAMIESDNQRTTADGSTTTTQSEEFVFTGLVTAMVREFAFEMLIELEALHAELCARTRWGQWERVVIASNDSYREAISQFTTFAAPGAFFRNHRAWLTVENDASAPTNNLFKADPPPFMPTFHRAMTSVRQSRDYLMRPVDIVAPREYGVVMLWALQFYSYPRSHDDMAVNDDDTGDETLSTTSASDGASLEQINRMFRERIVDPPLPPFAITLAKDTPSGSVDEMKKKFAKRALFPGGDFYMTTPVIDGFNSVHMNYLRNPEDKKILPTFCNAIAAMSAFQFEVLWMFVDAVVTYTSVFTVPLPEPIVREQLVAACERNKCSDPAFLPPQTDRSLVCLKCRRFAGPVVDEKQTKTSMRAYGTENTRVFLGKTTEELVRERVVGRNYALLDPFQCSGARSMMKVFEERALTTSSFYEQHFTVDPIDATQEAARRAKGFYDAVTPTNPWTGIESLSARRSVIDALFESAEIAEKQLPVVLHDSRLSDPAYRLDEDGNIVPPGVDMRGMRQPLIKPIGNEPGQLSERDFTHQVREEYDRLLGGNYLRVCHRLPTSDNRRFIGMGDSTSQKRAQRKKISALAHTKAEITLAPTAALRAQAQKRFERRRGRDTLGLLRSVECEQSLPYEFSRIGNALVIVRPGKPIEIYLNCCACGMSVSRSACVIRGYSYICPVCVARRNMPAKTIEEKLGQQNKLGVTSGFGASNAGTSVQMTLRQQLMSPSLSMIHDESVPIGTRCSALKCTVDKQAKVMMYRKEVVSDVYGNEEVGYIALCKNHAAKNRWIFSTPFALTVSAIGVSMLNGRPSVSAAELRNVDFLPIFLTRSAEVDAESTLRAQEQKARKRAALEIKRREEAGLVVIENN